MTVYHFHRWIRELSDGSAYLKVPAANHCAPKRRAKGQARTSLPARTRTQADLYPVERQNRDEN